MVAALNLGPLGTLAIVFAIVLTLLIIKAARAQNQPRRNLRASTRPPQMPRFQPPRPAPQPPAQRPLHIGESAEAEDVAKALAPEFIEVAHATTLVNPEEAAAPAKPAFSLRDADDIRRAFILKEVLGKPKALKRR